MTTGSTPPPAGDNQLARMGLPTFFEVGDLDGMALVPPPGIKEIRQELFSPRGSTFRNWGATPRSCAGTWRATTSSRMSFCRRAGQRAAQDGPAPSIRSRPPSS